MRLAWSGNLDTARSQMPMFLNEPAPVFRERRGFRFGTRKAMIKPRIPRPARTENVMLRRRLFEQDRAGRDRQEASALGTRR